MIRKRERTEGNDENAKTDKPKPIAAMIEAAFAVIFGVVPVGREDILHPVTKIAANERQRDCPKTEKRNRECCPVRERVDQLITLT